MKGAGNRGGPRPGTGLCLTGDRKQSGWAAVSANYHDRADLHAHEAAISLR
jgi:hypothetical protein